jgi:DNA-binding response OmpR family regulator
MRNNKKILIVEDNIEFLRLIEERLIMNGYEIITSQNGLEALPSVKRERPDLIILDIMLPGMDGLTVCRMIKFDQNLKNIPVLILTSRDTENAADLAKKCRADAFLIKTTKSEILLDVIKMLLQKSFTYCIKSNQ